MQIGQADPPPPAREKAEMKDKFNFNHVNRIEPKVVATYDAAKQHATGSYWVIPIQLTDQAQAYAFGLHFKVTDVAISGKVHYATTK
jgi:hypothetical protein